MSTMLEVINLKKYFNVANGGHLHAVDDVSFKIEKGETLGIVGESGCGKSTLGRTILRLHEPTGGKVIFDGMDIVSFDKEEMRQMRKEMQIIFQDPYASLNPRFTISQIIEEPLKLHNLYPSAAERKERVEQMMGTIVTAFEKQLDSLFGSEALDISADISVLETMLAREGLAGERMEAETTKNADGTDIKLEL